MARDKEKTIYANTVICLMMLCMRPILRKLLRSTVKKQSPRGRRSWGIDKFLASNKGRIERELLTIDHDNMYRNVLYPPDEESPRTDIHKWDLTLYLFILIDICRINRPKAYFFKQLFGIRNDVCKSSISAITRDICKDYRKRIKRLRSKFYRYLRDDDLKEKIEERANEIESGELSSSEIEEVLQRWKDLEVSKVITDAKTKNGLNRYLIVRTLLSKCCAEVMRALVIETAKRNGAAKDHTGHWSLDRFLRQHKSRIERRIHTVDKLERPMDTLFPGNGTTNLDEWDESLLSFILLNVCFLDEHMADTVADIRTVRNEISHCNTLNLTDLQYESYLEILKRSIKACLNFIDDQDLSSFINDQVREIEFKEGKDETIRRLQSSYQKDREDQEKREKAREVHERMQNELAEIVKKFKGIEMPEHQLELVIKTSSQELEKKLSKCIVEKINGLVKSEEGLPSSSENDDDIEMTIAVANLLEKWKSKGWVITESIEGSVLLNVRCSTFDDVCYMYNTHKGEGSNMHVSDLQTALQEVIGLDVKLSLVMYDCEMEKFMEKIVSSLLSRSKALTSLNTNGDRNDTKVRLYMNRCLPNVPTLTDVDLKELDGHLRRIAEVLEKKHDLPSVSLHVCEEEMQSEVKADLQIGESMQMTGQLNPILDRLDVEMDSLDSNKQTMEIETVEPYGLIEEKEEMETVQDMSEEPEPHTTRYEHLDLYEKMFGLEYTSNNMKKIEMKSEKTAGQSDVSDKAKGHEYINNANPCKTKSTYSSSTKNWRKLENEKYRNWVRGGLALKYLREGLELFTDEAVQQEHRRIIHTVNPRTVCTKCSLRDLKPLHKPEKDTDTGKKRCPLHHTNCNCLQSNTKSCPNRVCDAITEEILKAHRTDSCSLSTWKNTNIHGWCTNPWEIAKCFMPAPGYSDAEKASDVDVTGLLCLFMNNELFQDKFSCGRDIFREIQKKRNQIQHSLTMELSEEELIDCLDKITLILEDGKELKGRHDAQQAARNVKMLKVESFIITIQKEVEVCRDSLSSIRQEIEGLKQTLQDAKDAIDMKPNRIIDIEGQIGKLDIIHHHRREKLYLTRKQALQFDLVQYYAKHYTKIQPLSSRMQDTLVNIEELYVPPRMVIKEAKYETDGENDTLNHSSEKQLYLYRDMFQTNGKKHKSIYISGGVGMGKTAFCQMMAINWCASVVCGRSENTSGDCYKGSFVLFQDMCRHTETPLNSIKNSFKRILEADIQSARRIVKLCATGSFDDDGATYNDCSHEQVTSVLANAEANHLCTDASEDTIQNDNIIAMKDFDFLFFIPLQRMSGVSSDIIELTKALNEEFTSKGFIKEIFEKEPERCLVVIDGLDEWNSPNTLLDTNVPKHDAAQHAVIITLSRPSAVQNQNPSQYDQRIVLQGISRDNINIFVERYVSKLKLKEICLQDFVRDVRKLEHLEKTPLLLQQLICMYANGDTVGNSVSDIYCQLVSSMLSWSEKREEKENTVDQMKVPEEFEHLCLPLLLSRYPSCLSHKRILFLLGRMAFEVLTSDERTNRFGRNHLDTGLLEEDLSFLIKCGILIEYDSYVRRHETTFFEFVHSTYLEFFAAVYVTSYLQETQVPIPGKKPMCKPNVVEMLFQRYNSAAKIVQDSNILLMICGLDPSLIEETSALISNVVSADEGITRYRNDPLHTGAYDTDVPRQIQRLLYGCLCECGADCETTFNLCDVFVDEVTPLSFLGRIIPNSVLTLNMKHISDSNMWNWVVRLNRLQSVIIKHSDIPHDLFPLLSSKRSLKYLYIG